MAVKLESWMAEEPGNSIRTAVQPKAKDKEQLKQNARATVAPAEQFIRLFEVGGLSKRCLSVRKSMRTLSRQLPPSPSSPEPRTPGTYRRISAVFIVTRPLLVRPPKC